MASLCLPLALGLLTACGDFLANIPARPAASDDPTIAEAEYPSLASVPARPQLTYTLEQRREIAQGLVADRANARYAGDTLREDLGRPVEPDTAPPLPPLPVTAPRAADPESDLTLAYIEDTLARESDDGSLGDFLDRLERRPPASAEARPSPAPPPEPPAEPAAVIEDELPAASDAVAIPATAVAGAEPRVEPAPPAADAAPAFAAAAAEAPPAPARETLPEAVAETTTAALPLAEPTATRPPTPPPSAPALPLAIVFDPGAVDLAGEAQAQLQRLAPRLGGNATTIVVSGGGERAGLAMERARRVAAMLVNAGIPPGRIAIEMGGESDVVVVYEAGA